MAISSDRTTIRAGTLYLLLINSPEFLWLKVKGTKSEELIFEYFFINI